MADDLPPGFTLDPPKDGPPAGFTLDEPKSGGAFAAKELAPGQAEQGERRRKLMQLIEAKGEPGYGARLADNFTMGLNRPLGGVASVAGGGSYQAGVGAEEDYIKRAEANTNPWLGGAADIVGGLASGGPGRQLVRGAATVAQPALTKAQQLAKWLVGSGAGSGAIEGAARNAESLEGAGTGAAVGGVVGGAADKVLGALTGRLRSVQGAKREVGVASREGGSQALKDEGGDIYRRLDDAGIHYSPRETAPLAGNVAQRLSDAGFNPNMHRELIPAIGEIGGTSGSRTTWTQLQNIRTQISDLKASPDPRLRRVAGELNDELDTFIRTAKPTMPASSVAAGVNPAQEIEVARDLWKRGSMTEKVEHLSEKGLRKAKDPAAKLEKNFESYQDKVAAPGKYDPYANEPERRALMDAIVEGSPKLSATADTMNRWGGNLLGYGTAGAVGGAAVPYLFPDSSVGGGATAGGLAALGAGALMKGGGRGLRQVAAEKGQQRVDDLIRNLVTGTTEKAAVQNVPREALAKLVAEQQLRKAAGSYTSNFLDRE